jgi:hypothetical protein
VAARREAEEITREAEDRVKELDLETDRIWEERLRIVEDARELARQLETLADTAAQRFPAEETASTEAVVQPDIAEIFSAPVEEPAGEVVAEQAEVSEPAGEVVAEQAEVVSEPPPGEDAPEVEDREATAIMPPVTPPADEDTTQ